MQKDVLLGKIEREQLLEKLAPLEEKMLAIARERGRITIERWCLRWWNTGSMDVANYGADRRGCFDQRVYWRARGDIDDYGAHFEVGVAFGAPPLGDIASLRKIASIDKLAVVLNL